ncbi:hypothetical protein LTR37_001250 [Vermiconidia calcicola]|uniref:Uncharacterized protein n=1 Tax=Vermiconidia calcicola TaxID=1690605 RepID=A0ACC3NWJ6_9PEZI|nr:hypothetical protein LTR37_001250 [Vermiconidia calcicola]
MIQTSLDLSTFSDGKIKGTGVVLNPFLHVLLLTFPNGKGDGSAEVLQQFVDGAKFVSNIFFDQTRDLNIRYDAAQRLIRITGEYPDAVEMKEWRTLATVAQDWMKVEDKIEFVAKHIKAGQSGTEDKSAANTLDEPTVRQLEEQAGEMLSSGSQPSNQSLTRELGPRELRKTIGVADQVENTPAAFLNPWQLSHTETAGKSAERRKREWKKESGKKVQKFTVASLTSPKPKREPYTREEEAYLCALRRLDPSMPWDEIEKCTGREEHGVRTHWGKLVVVDAKVTEMAQLVRCDLMVQRKQGHDDTSAKLNAPKNGPKEAQRQHSPPSDPPDSPPRKKSSTTVVDRLMQHHIGSENVEDASAIDTEGKSSDGQGADA